AEGQVPDAEPVGDVRAVDGGLRAVDAVRTPALATARDRGSGNREAAAVDAIVADVARPGVVELERQSFGKPLLHRDLQRVVAEVAYIAPRVGDAADVCGIAVAIADSGVLRKGDEPCRDGGVAIPCRRGGLEVRGNVDSRHRCL